MGFNITIDKDKCTGCEECVQTCTRGVLEMHNGRSSAVSAEKCAGCQSCVEICEQKAIRVEETGIEMSKECLSLLRDIL